jgi:hypothetical protein
MKAMKWILPATIAMVIFLTSIGVHQPTLAGMNRFASSTSQDEISSTDLMTGSDQAGDLGAGTLQTTVTLYAVADATVRSAQPNTNFGGEHYLAISFEAPNEEITLLRFDLGSIPANAVIDSAVMELYLFYAAGQSPKSLATYRVTSSWSEYSVTWNTFPTADPTGIISSVDSVINSYKSWSITGFASYWHSNPTNNHGVYIRRLTSETNYFERIFESKDHNGQKPRLVVTYHLPTWTFQGRVFEGEVGNETHPLSNVTVSAYGANSPYPNPGVLLDSTTTDINGWYTLTVPEGYEFYSIRESDPPGYFSVGATTVGGIVRDANWIEYAYPLDGKVLTGNKFWDMEEGPGDTLPPGNWANFSPVGWVNLQAAPVSIQVEDTQSGLNVGTAAYSFSNDNGASWSDWEPADCTGSNGTTSPQVVSATVRFDQDGGATGPNKVRFRIEDMAGNFGTSGEYIVKIDTVAPANPTTLSSPSHSVNVWSNNNKVTIQWSGASDDRSGICGYSYSWSHSPTTVPDSSLDTSQTSLVDYPLGDAGDWWFHIRSIDVAGNAGVGAVHLGPIKIDTDLPTSWISSPATTNNPSFIISWAGGDTGSGIASYDVQHRDLTTGSSWSALYSEVTFTSATYPGKHGHIYEFRVRARDHAGNQEPWPTNPQTKTKVTTVDFEAFGLEITQAVQDFDNSVILIQSKRTFARFHVRSLLNGEHGPVKAQLEAWRGGLYLGAIPASNAGANLTIRQNPDRSQLTHSFYFDVPASWLSGSVMFKAQVDPDGKWAETTISNNSLTTIASFENSPLMYLGLVDICYTIGNTTYNVSNEERWELQDWLKAAYPIHTLKVKWGYLTNCYIGHFDADGRMTTPNSGQVNNMLAWHHSRAVAEGNEEPYARYYGMVDDGGGFMRGAAMGIPSTIASGPVWPGNAWYGGHELGHAYGQVHTQGITPPPCGTCGTPACNGQCGCEGGAVVHYSNGDISPTREATRPDALYGLNVTTNPPTIYPPDWKDVMTYCVPEWVSDYTYEGIHEQMLDESGTTAQSISLVVTSEHLAVFGSINTASNEVILDAFYRVPNAWDIFGRVPGDYSIRLLDSGGITLANYSFTPRLTHEDPGPTCAATMEEPLALLAEYVPWVAGTARVAIYHGPQELVSRDVSANAPQVTLTHPNDGVLDGNEITVTWSASDPDGDSLEFTLEYSVDGGEHWIPIGSQITSKQLVIKTELLPGTTQGKFRVVATDGVNTAMDASDGLLTVENKAPIVHISSPQPESIFWPGQPVALMGAAIDVEDGSLSGSTLTWHSDISGNLGIGELLHRTDLVQGTHTITLTATDSDGMKNSATVTIYIVDEFFRSVQFIYLPVVSQ